MSLHDVNVISGIKFDVTPNGGSTTSRSYIAQNVQVIERWQGETWQTSDYRNHINTQARHLIFQISGQEIDQVTNKSNKRSITALDQDLKQPDAFTVELYPDMGQSKKFEVISYEPGDRMVAAFENLARSDQQEINCITKNKVTRSDVEFFERY